MTVKEKTDSQTSNNGSSGTDQTNQNDKTQTAIQTDDYTIFMYGLYCQSYQL